MARRISGRAQMTPRDSQLPPRIPRKHKHTREREQQSERFPLPTATLPPTKRGNDKILISMANKSKLSSSLGEHSRLDWGGDTSLRSGSIASGSLGQSVETSGGVVGAGCKLVFIFDSNSDHIVLDYS